MNKENLSSSTITVKGSAQIERLPDTAYVNLAVNTSDKDLSKAQSANAETARVLIEKIAEINVKKSDITTGGYSLYPQYDYKNNTKTLRGYNVVNSLRVKVTDFTLLGRIIDVAGLSGVAQINGIEFALKDSAAAYDEALKNALKNARKKAELLAEQESCNLGGIVSISELESEHHVAMPVMARAFALDTAVRTETPINAEQITIKATVQAEYNITLK